MPDSFPSPAPEAPLNIEPPLAALDAPLTPIGTFFTRNNGTVPKARGDWSLAVTGLVSRPLSLSPDALRARFPIVELVAVMECAGNARSAITPAAEGLAWGPGAVGCARWTGVRLADVLAAAGLDPAAQHVGFRSPDHVIGQPGVPALSRGVPLAKALAPETLVAFAMNGAPLTALHGAPLRIVAPGFPGSAWQKWLHEIVVLDREHDGAKMTGLDYRMPRRPLRPGEDHAGTPFDAITDMPVKSLITAPLDGFSTAGPVALRGFAWSGHIPLTQVEVSADGGATWRPARLDPAASPWAWRRFTAELDLAPGAVEVMARATDMAGNAQPMAPVWNPRGYLNNAVHRVRRDLRAG
jgi:DMSO/TMAO reductase YedYZ molybdopterin-dependent catalytic subunit